MRFVSFFTSLTLTLLFLTGEEAKAQSSTDRRPPEAGNRAEEGEPKRGGLFNRLFEPREDVAPKPAGSSPGAVALAPDGTSPAPGAASALPASAQDMVRQAAEALRMNPSELEGVGKQLLSNPDALMAEGARLLEDEATVTEATRELEQAAGDRGLDPSSLKSVAGRMVPAASAEQTIAAAKSLLDRGEPAPAPEPRLPAPRAEPNAMNRALTEGLLGEGEVPEPKDPVATPIPRPQTDPGNLTRITADASEFDANTRVVTFEGNVELDHPEFDLTCQILVAELKDDGSGGESMDPTQRAATGGIERATARGYVQIEKLAPDGKIQVAKARTAVFENATGDVTLTEYPILQDGNNLIRGVSETTRIYLRPSGKYNVEGPAKYELVTESNALQLR